MRRHLTYANVVSSLCLFILLGGSAYAASTIGSKQIKNNSIQGKDIKNGSVTGTDIKKKTLTSGLFKSGQLPRGATGATGATGPQGPAGQNGAPAATAFAAVNENGGLSFGKGVTSVTGGGPSYTIDFDRSLTNCALIATQGFGTPSTGANSTYSQIQVTASVIGGNVVVNTNDPANGAGKKAAFFLAVLC